MSTEQDITNLQSQLLQHQHTNADGTKSFPFTNLKDVPVSYRGNAGSSVIVNSTETGLTFGQSIFAGSVTDSGDAGNVFPLGWSVLYDNINDIFLVTHNLETVNYVVTATITGHVTNPWSITIYQKDTNTFNILTSNAGLQGEFPFDFILITGNI